jgi:Tfp pilus assembly protein PilO
MDDSRLKLLDRICLVTLLVVALLGTVFTAGAFISQERRLQQEKDRNVQESGKLAEAEKNRKALRQALTQVKEETAGLNKRIPQKTDVGALMKYLNLRMKERRIKMAIIQPQTAIAEEFSVKIPIRLTFQGSFFQSYLFLSDLETMDQLLIPEKISMTGLEPSRECQVDLTVLVFEQKFSGSGDRK